MNEQKKINNIDQTMVIILSNILRSGVFIAGAIVIIGAFFFLVRHGSEVPNYQIFKPDTFSLSDFKDLFKGIIALRSASIMELGILMLIATPVLRVCFSVLAFIYEEDYLYVVFTIIVLLVLIFSFFS